MPHIRLEHVSKSYAGGAAAPVTALHEVTIEIADGELLALVGPSGSGKTSLLRIVAGLEAPTAGRVFFDGTEVTAVPPERRGIGMVFQRGALFPHLSAFENLALGLRLRRRPDREVRVRVNEVAEVLGLSPVLSRRPPELSGGERQRVSLGRVLLAGASVLLLDEPLAALDPPLRAQLRREIAQIHQQRALTVLHVTHDQSEALGWGGRTAVLRSGGLQQVGTAGELLRSPANLFVAQFLGTPAMNLIPGRVTWSGDQARFEADAEHGERLTVSLPPPGKAHAAWAGKPSSVVLGIRPRDLRPRGAEALGDGFAAMAAVAERVEDTGGAAWLHVRWGTRELLAATPDGMAIQPGQVVRLGFELGRAHWFEAGSGAALPVTGQA